MDWISDIWTIKIFFNMFALYICSLSDLGAAGTNQTLTLPCPPNTVTVNREACIGHRTVQQD